MARKQLRGHTHTHTHIYTPIYTHLHVYIHNHVHKVHTAAPRHTAKTSSSTHGTKKTGQHRAPENTQPELTEDIIRASLGGGMFAAHGKEKRDQETVASKGKHARSVEKNVALHTEKGMA